MTNIYTVRTTCTPWIRKISLLVLVLFASFSATVQAQVDLTATAGILNASYPTLGAAFGAINEGAHQGNITITLNDAVIEEGSVPATLNGNNADPATYTSVTIRPGQQGVVVRGNPGVGFGVVQFFGASNVTINGDDANSPGINRDLTFENYSAAANQNTSCIRIAVNGTTATNANNINILNCEFIGNVTAGNNSGLSANTLSANLSYGIFVGGGVNGIQNADPVPALTNALASLTDSVAPSGSSISNMYIAQNGFTSMGRAIVFNGGATSVGSNLNITSNNIGTPGSPGAWPHTGITNTVYAAGIQVSGTEDVAITGNSIDNVFSYLNIYVSGIALGANIGGGTLNIEGNTITTLASNYQTNATTSSAIAIGVASAENDYTIINNTITGVSARSTNTTGFAPSGISVSATGGAASIYNNNISGVRNFHATLGYAAYGINLAAGDNQTVYNNFVSNILSFGGGSFLANRSVAGIYVGGGAGHLIAHNSVNMYGTMNSTSASTLGYNVTALLIANSGSGNMTIKNNILTNTVTNAGTANNHVYSCIHIPFTAATLASLNLDLNNNAYYSSGNALSAIALGGGTTFATATVFTAGNFFAGNNNAANNWRNFSSQIGRITNDDHSLAFTTAAPFVSPTDLHINGASSPLESGGVPVGISQDIDGDGRSGTFPDIGADEINITRIDNLPPYVNFTPLATICALGNRTLTATISDPSGVPTAGLGLPVLYWRINAGAYTAVTGVHAGGNTYNFTFGAGAVVGDVITYYIVSQDLNGTPNSGAYPSAGSAGYNTNPPSVTTPPTATPTFQYTVSTALAAGTYLVGTGEPVPFNTLQNAIAAYNVACLGGNITFLLKDVNYNVPSMITIFNPEASNTKRLTIKPNVATNVTITGAAPTNEALFKLNGADYITFDGSNVVSGTTRNLTISNTGAGNTIWIASNGISNGATNNTIKNCIITGVTGTSFTGVVQSGGVTPGSIAQIANTNNTYTNNQIYGGQYGLSLVGPVGNENGNVVSDNLIGSTVPAQYLSFRGMFFAQQSNVTILNNEVTGVYSTAASTTNMASGIYIGGTMSGGHIDKNRIHNLKNTNTGGWAIHGISLRSSSANTALYIINNFIWDVKTYGWTPSTTPIYENSGIQIGTGGGYRMYYNTINMGTNPDVPGVSTALYVTTTVGGNLIRNNIFANTQTTGTRYGVYVNGTINPNIFSIINHNNYYSTGALGFVAGGARANIASWRAGTGQDVNSLDVNPLFVSPTDLHLSNASPLNHTGIHINPVCGSCATDIDGDVRATGSGPTAPDIGADEFTPPNCGPGPLAGGTASINITDICVSGDVTLSATGYAFGEGMEYFWQSAPAAGGPWTNIPGATSASGVTVTATATTYYRLYLNCPFGGTGNSNVVSVNVNIPVISSTTPATRCGFGQVTLSASTVTPGADVKWFNDPVGGLPLFTGNNFTTNVTSTRLFYVEASIPGVTGVVGPVSPTAQGGTIGTQTIDWDVYFDVLQPTTLISIDIFPMTAGQSGSIFLKDPLGATIATYPFVTTASGGATPQTILINYALTPGTNYSLDTDLPTSGVRRNTTNGSYPYTSAAINITRNGFSQAYYMGLYNWQFTSSCASQPRTAVQATVTAPPAVVLNPSQDTTNVCSGSSVNLTITGASYSTFTWYNNRNNAINGTGNIGTGGSISVSPTSDTWYYVVSTQTPANCARIDSVKVNVKPVPTPLTLTPFPIPPYCFGNLPIRMDITGGVLSNIVALTADFEGTAPGWITYDNNVGGTPSEGQWTLRPSGFVDNGTWQSNTNDQFYHVSSDNQGSGSTTEAYLESPTFSLAGFTTANLSFWHYYNYLSGDFARVEISTDGGSSWNTLVQYNSDQGAVANFANPIIPLTPYLGETNLKIRFYYQAAWDWNWGVDNVLVIGDQQLNITWTPNYNLYLNYTGTVPNIILGTPYTTGNNAPLIYAAPDVDTTYTANVTSPNGCVRQASLFVASINNPVSVDMTTSEPTLEICAGTNVTFTALPTNEGTNWGYDWYINDVIVASTPGTTPNWSTTAIANGDEVKVRLSSNITCATNNPAFADSLVFTVNPLQPVSVSVSSSDIDNIICAGESVTFTANPTNGGTGPVYQWMVNSVDQPGETGVTFTTTTLNNGDIVQVRLTSDVTPCATGNPAVSTGINMTVNPLLVPSVSITANPGVDICSGTNVTFTATPVNGGGTPSYQWYLNGSPVGTNSNTYSNNTLADLDEVYVVMTTSETCFTTATATSNTLIINLTGALPVSVVLSTPQTSVCGTPNVTFTATPTNGGTIPNYEFFVNSVSVQNGTSATYTYVPANGDQVEVILTSDLACATGNPATSNLITMTVNPTPAAPSITAGGPTTFCAGGSVTLTSSVPTGNTWSPGGATTSSINVTASGSYTVIQTVAGCPSAPSAAVVVTVNPIPPTPTINVTGGSAPYCSGTNYTLTSSAASGNLWSPGGQTTVSINTSTAGSYTVTQTLLGCTSLPSTPVVINASPTVNITGSNDYCGTPVLLTANAVAGSGTITTYQWFQGATPVGTNSATYSANANGSYTVVVTNSNGCSITSAPHVLGLPTGPLNGVYTVSAAPLSCTNFPSIKDAIDALNTRSISGNVTFNVAAGFVEPATGGKLILGNTTLNAAVNAGPYNIIFQKDGAGANPLINAYTGSAPNSNNANPDGIWAIAGTDNVTIDGIDLADANATTTTQMEFGYGLFKLNNNDGAQNITIQNCTITLTTNNAGSATSIMPEGSTGILVLNSTPTAATTILTPTVVSGTNSNNRFYSNTISNVNNGIVLIGYVAPSPYNLGDVNNDIGGTSLATGNTIENFGGGGALASAGIEAANQWDINISYNTINNNTGAHTNHGGQLRGILCNGPGTVSAYLGYSENSNVDITYNTITVKNNATQPVVGIENGIGGSGNTSAPSVGNVVNINNNNILNSGNTPSLGNVFYGIFNYAAAERTNINNNHIDGIESYGTGNAYMIYTSANPSPVVNTGVDVYIENNLIENVSKVSTTTGTLRGIITQNRINNFYVQNNTIQDFELNTVSGTASMEGIYSLGSAQMVYINNNIVRNFLKSGAGNSTFQGIRNNDVNGAGFVKEFVDNEVYNISTGTGGVHNFYGIWSGQGDLNLVRGNKIYSIENNSTAAGGSVTGIIASNLAVNHTIEKNEVYNISAQGPSPTVSGILVVAALSSQVNNNFISDLRAPLASSADAVRGVSYTSTTANSSHGLYYNTIYLNATSSGANFGTSGVYHTANATATTSALDMRNNIIVNTSTPNGTGVTAALRRNAVTLGNFATTSNYNLLYAGTPSANRVVYFNTTAVQTLAAYQTAVTPRESASVSMMPTFINIAVSPFNLRLDQNQNCGISKLGNNTGILIPDDFDGEARAVIAPFLTDIGADEFISTGGAPYTWKGVNTNWEDPANWCTGVPQSTHNVIIPTGMANYPVLTTGTNVAGSVNIQNGANITINSGGVLTVHGASFTIDGTLANNGNIRFNGTAAQSFGGGAGTITAMHTLEMNNTTTLSIDKNLSVTGAILPNAGTITVNNVNITLVSSATATASVGPIGTLPGFAYNGTGKFIVENYIASGGSNEGWRFLSIPTQTTQTINQAWMEGQTPGNYTSTGYGMQIVGPASAGSGFDVNTPTTSLKTFASATNTWITVPGTGGAINNDLGYMAFIRGDRGSNTFGSSSNTVLRTEGPIKTDELTVNHTGAGQFVSVGNPFPCAISFAGFTRTNLGNYFYVWDPKLGTYGGYQTFSQAGPIYVPTPGGGSYGSGNYNIESGQAFLVYTTGASSTLVINEGDKVLGSNPVTRPQSDMGMLSTRIYNMGGAEPHLTDGVLSIFDPLFSNAVDAEDAVKAGNFNESFGIRTGESVLSVETRDLLNERDTIQYVFGALRANTPYRLALNAERLDAPGMEAWLEDRFLNTFTPVSLSGTTEYDFTIQQAPASYATDRFRVVFKLARPLPVRFTRIDATVDDKDVNVKWEVAEEVNINTYTIQRSVDGRNFTDIGNQTATGSQAYMYTDVRPGNGVFYYRIRSNGNGSDIQYSRIVSVILSDAPGTITVYPNPVQDDKLVKVNMNNMPKGRYQVVLVNSSGQVVFRRQIDHAGGNMVYDVRLGYYLAHGTYTMQITGNGKSKTSIKIVY